MEALRLRPATASDAALLLRWRDDTATREASRHTAEVGADEHAAWLDAVLASGDRDLFVVECGRVPVGQLRFDAVGEGDFEISVGLDPSARGAGLGAPTIAVGLDWLWRERPGARRVVAVVRDTNAPSLRAFARAGFVDAGAADHARFRRLVTQRP